MDKVANKLRSNHPNVMIMPVASQDLVPLTLDGDIYRGAGMYICIQMLYQYLHKVSICAYGCTFY